MRAVWLLPLALASACGDAGSEARPAEHEVVVQVTKAVRQEIVRKATLPAAVRADMEVVLHSKIAGYVKTVAKDIGDRVTAGEIVAVLEVPEMALDLESARAQFALEESTLKRLEAIRQVEKTAVTDQDLELTRAKRDIAFAARQRLETLLKYAEIRAPFDGVVTERYVEPGAFVQQGRIVKLTNAAKVRIEVDVPETEVPFVAAGTPASVRLEAVPGRTFSTTVTRLSGVLHAGTRTMRVELETPNPDGALRPGMSAVATLQLERRAQAVLVPTHAIVTHESVPALFLCVDGKAKRVPIATGIQDGGWTEAVRGLSGDELVILPSAKAITDGMRVRFVEANEP